MKAVGTLHVDVMVDGKTRTVIVDLDSNALVVRDPTQLLADKMTRYSVVNVVERMTHDLNEALKRMCAQ